MTDDKYDVTYTLPANTVEGILLPMRVSYEVRCGSLGMGVSVIDSFGHISMITSQGTVEEGTAVEALLIEHARGVCRV